MGLGCRGVIWATYYVLGVVGVGSYMGYVSEIILVIMGHGYSS